MFKRISIILVIACLSGSAVAQAGEVIIQPDPVVPFPIYSTDPDTPPGPTNLNATSDASGAWTVTWDQPTDGTDPVAVDNYTVYWRDAMGAWQDMTVDDAFTEAQIGLITGAAVVTVIANVDDEPSAAWEYVMLADLDPGPVFPCPVVRAYLYPHPPGVLLRPQCIPM